MGMKLAAVTVASVVGLAASAYTNMHQLVNVRITPEVLAQMPTNDFSSPQMTVLCFERAMRSGDCTNLFNCCFGGQWKIYGWDDILEKGW